MLRAFWVFAANSPDGLTMVISAVVAPPAPFIPTPFRGKRTIVIARCWCGNLDAGNKALAPFRAQLRPDVDLVAPNSYPALQASLDPNRPLLGA